MDVETVYFYKDSNENWFYELDDTPIPSVNRITPKSTVAVSSWNLAPNFTSSGSGDFTYSPINNLTLNGWQQPINDFSKEANSIYYLMLKSGSSYSQASAISYYGTFYESGNWLSLQFNNATAGATYKVQVKNTSSVSCKGAFNVYN